MEIDIRYGECIFAVLFLAINVNDYSVSELLEPFWSSGTLIDSIRALHVTTLIAANRTLIDTNRALIIDTTGTVMVR